MYTYMYSIYIGWAQTLPARDFVGNLIPSKKFNVNVDQKCFLKTLGSSEIDYFIQFFTNIMKSMCLLTEMRSFETKVVQMR